ncbi:sporulation protein, YlmC/YmxH family [Clostridium amylolyticum]|uniref:Sporulation protein, YlmC/YmxH family n=1 Tax=Clostridium amylolyticum TaxID=1121298 RepID=A0A1M6D2W1_9CLOT|nr:YlmC/YmxH family sporulation protein [Clostridium amylolyticum]SHI67414.1 sporulation protein, YlmC/YmxH family [Clostridium amylolyticum]
MENSLFSINNIRNMEVIDISNGIKLGYIKDFKVDCDNYTVISILIPINKNNWLSKYELMEIPWSNIVKIGIDVILVEGESKNATTI